MFSTTRWVGILGWSLGFAWVAGSEAARADTLRFECPGGSSAVGVGALADAAGLTKQYASAINNAGMKFDGSWVMGRSVVRAGSVLSCFFTLFQNDVVLYKKAIPVGYDRCSASGGRVTCTSSANASKRLTLDCPLTADVGANLPAPFDRGDVVSGLALSSARFNPTTHQVSCSYYAIDSEDRNILDRLDYLRVTVPEGYTCRVPLDGAASIPDTAVSYSLECSNS